MSALIVLAMLVGGATPAEAAGTYSVTSAVNVRAAPSTSSPVVGSIPARRSIVIECQTTGTNISGSTVWDKVPAYGGYISDFLVNGTPFAVFDGRLPRCGAAPVPAATAGLTTRTSAQVNLRTAPSFNAPSPGALGAGAPVTISCQSYGTKVNGSFIWDRVGDQWISDFFVNGTPFNAFDSRIPRCSPGWSAVDCDRVLFLGARGSGEPFGDFNMGSGGPVDATYRKLSALGANLDAAGIVYPAQSVDVLGGDPAAYFAGEGQGVDRLVEQLRRRTDGNVCGWQNTRVVLAGYSQGAMVVRDAINRMTPEERRTIKGVVTFGNPYHYPGVNGDYLGGSRGILGSSAVYPGAVDQLSRDYCLNDVVCAKAIGPGAISNHMKYTEWGWADDAAAFLKARL